MHPESLPANKRTTAGITQNRQTMMYENRKDAAEYLADSVLTTARVEAESHILKENRERMIKDDTMGDYTRTKNAIEDGVGLFGFLLNKFRK